MTDYYWIRHDSSSHDHICQIYEIVNGLDDRGRCRICGTHVRLPVGDLRVTLGESRGNRWPDLMACGDYPCFVVSNRFLNEMKDCEIVTLLGGGVEFVRPGGSRLHLPDSLEYFWLDGGRHRAASVDFERSGFVDVRFCELCGTRTEDMEATYVRRRAEPPPPLVLDYDESLGLDLFTTDLSPTAFFSTDRVLDCVRRSKLTNIQFVPTKDGALGKPIRQ